MPRIVLEGVTKVFQRPGAEPTHAVSALSLAIEDRECLVIVGPSGSGKTTVLRLIAGLDLPTAGEISMDGKGLNGIPARQREVAMVFQSPALYPHMSVQENLQFGLKLRGCSRGETAGRVAEAAEVLGLTGCLQAQPSQLSGGQRQRVAIGRAIVRRAPVLLLDEPLANLDPQLRTQLRQDLRNVRAKFGTTMVYVTHDHLEAMLMADRLAVLRAGRLQQLEAPRTVYQRPANLFIAGFFGFPRINLFRGRFLRRGSELFFQIAPGAGETSALDDLEAKPPAAGAESAQAFCLPLDARWTSAAERHWNQTIILAIRPERICPVSAQVGQPAPATVRARIDAAHSAGADTFIVASCGGSSFNARVPANGIPALGQERAFAFDTESACLFDSTTGNALEFL